MLSQLREDIKPQISITPWKPTQINDLVCFLQTPLMPYLPKKHIQELSLRITPEDYPATTLKCSRIVAEHLKYTSQEFQQNKDLIMEFKEQRHFPVKTCSNWDSDGHAFRRPQKQSKPIDVSILFESHHWPAPSETDSPKIPASEFDTQSMWYNKNDNRKCCFRHRVKIINEPSTAFKQCQTYCSLEQVEPMFYHQELSITATLWYQNSPFIHPTCLCADDPPHRIQQDPQMPVLEDPNSAETSSPRHPTSWMKPIKEAQRHRYIKCW